MDDVNVMEPNSLALIPNYFDSIESAIVCQSPTVEVVTADHGDVMPTPRARARGNSLLGACRGRKGRGRPRKRPNCSASVVNDAKGADRRQGRGYNRKQLVDLAIDQIPDLTAHEASLDDRIDYQRVYDEALFRYYADVGGASSSAPPVKRHRATYSANDAIRVLKYIQERNASVRDTSRKFNIPKSTVQDIKKRGMPLESSSKRGRHRPGAGRPISYGSELDQQLLSWVLHCDEQHLLVTIKALKTKAVELITPLYPAFKASDSWLRHFLFRHSSVINPRNMLTIIGNAKTPVSITEKMIQIGAIP